MEIEKQFSIFMVNKPGILAQILAEFARAKINITALTVMDSVEHGVLRVVCKSADKMQDVLKHLNAQYNEAEVLCITISNRPGAFAAITEKLAKAHINIAYAYCTAGAKGGKTTAIVKVADIKKAIKTLKDLTEPNGKEAITKKHRSFRLTRPQ
ncbi:MAG: ACT domain-containing protein [Sedimentisphaerales bacterium]|nr:ACT domain-containing protein [Sedimentisphaerales bacterium]